MAIIQRNPYCQFCDHSQSSASHAWARLGEEKDRVNEAVEFLGQLALRLERVEPMRIISNGVDPYRIEHWQPQAHEISAEIQSYLERLRNQRGPLL